MDMILVLFGAYLVLKILFRYTKQPKVQIRDTLSPKQMRVTVEEYAGIFYLFNAEDRGFIAQGADLPAVIDHMRDRKMFNIEMTLSTTNKAALDLFSESIKI
jgi:hypothetical protein